MSSTIVRGPPSSTDGLQFANVFGSGAQVVASVGAMPSAPFVSVSANDAKRRFATAATAPLKPRPFPFGTQKANKQLGARLLAADTTTVKSTAACPLSPLLVTLASTFHLPLYAPAKDPSTNEWAQVGDLLPPLMLLYGVQGGREGDLEVEVDARVNSLLETVSLSWSDVWIHPGNLHSRSAFLAIGSKEGTITLWKLDAGNHVPIYLTSIKPHNAWASRTAWSQWLSVGPIQYCYMLSAYSDGQLFSHLITYDPNSANLTIIVTAQLSPADNKPASVLKFHHSNPSLIRAAVSKGSTLHMWTAPTPTSLFPPSFASTETSQIRSLHLPLSMPVGGITWNLLGDEIHVYSTEGKCFTVALIADQHPGPDTPPSHTDASTFSGEDNFDPTSSAAATLVLLEDTTSQFYKEILGDDASGGNAEDDAAGEEEEGGEGGGPTSSHGKQIRFYGAVSSPNGLVDFVLYNVSMSEGLEYRTGKTDNCQLLVHWNYSGRRAGNEVEDIVLRRIQNVLVRDDMLFRFSPAHLVWDVLGMLHHGFKEGEEVVVQDDGLVAKVLHEIIKFTMEFQGVDGQRAIVSPGGPAEYLKNVPEMLFSNRRMNALRLQNHIYLHLINTIPSLNKQETANLLLQNYRNLLQSYISVMLHHTHQYLQHPRVLLSETDLLMLTLLSDHCLQNSAYMGEQIKQLVHVFATVKQRGAEPHIASICDEYLIKFRTVIQGGPGDPVGGMGESKEQCLACGGAVVFVSPWKAICLNGHPWDRCAVSLLTAATPKTRSCLGCNRKTISPEALGDGEPEGGQGEGPTPSVVMKTLVQCMTVCLYCGNRLKL
ncbi:hypothetical protein HDU79_009525 [Rhizoclosmatium sp. JEL0117]|nr:hypothetical protein HDU79_009525 [Rhizoclosmatium sp. JEL0117]